jgi:hypothetical protein
MGDHPFERVTCEKYILPDIDASTTSYPLLLKKVDSAGSSVAGERLMAEN